MPKLRVASALDVTAYARFQISPQQMIVATTVALLDQPERRIDEAPKVYVLEHLQTRPPCPLGQLPTAVAPLVAQEAVVVVIDTRAGGNHKHSPCPRTQHSSNLGQCLLIVGHMLEHVSAEDRVDACVRQWQSAKIGLHQARLGHIGVRLAQTRANQIHTD